MYLSDSFSKERILDVLTDQDFKAIAAILQNEVNAKYFFLLLDSGNIMTFNKWINIENEFFAGQFPRGYGADYIRACFRKLDAEITANRNGRLTMGRMAAAARGLQRLKPELRIHDYVTSLDDRYGTDVEEEGMEGSDVESFIREVEFLLGFSISNQESKKKKKKKKKSKH